MATRWGLRGEKGCRLDPCILSLWKSSRSKLGVIESRFLIPERSDDFKGLRVSLTVRWTHSSLKCLDWIFVSWVIRRNLGVTITRSIQRREGRDNAVTDDWPPWKLRSRRCVRRWLKLPASEWSTFRQYLYEERSNTGARMANCGDQDLMNTCLWTPFVPAPGGKICY